MKQSIANSGKTYPAAMTVAGSDSGGGAGIQADLRTFHYFRVFGTSAITAVTFQNPLEVTGIEPLTPEGVEAQIRTVRKVIDLRAAKTGMLFSREIILSVAKALSDFTGPLVVDPVMISTSGKKLLRDDAVSAVGEVLLPLADWITPNLPEAEALTGRKIQTLPDAVAAAKFCADFWHCGVVIKGGHAQGPEASDVVVCDGEVWKLTTPRLPVRSNADHGTGCTFSSALTALLARSVDWHDALIQAKAFVLGSLADTVELSENGLSAMYPPEESLDHFCNRIVCERVEL